MKKCIVLGCLIFSFFNSFSQAEIEMDTIFEYEEMPHSIYFELGGHARYYSINYERFLYGNFYFSPSIGGGISYISALPIINGNVNLNRDFNEKHRMHIGLGISLGFPPNHRSGDFNLLDYVQNSISGTGVFYLGYKYSIPNRNWFLGIVSTTFFSPSTFENDFFILPHGGLRVGYQFH